MLSPENKPERNLIKLPHVKHLLGVKQMGATESALVGMCCFGLGIIVCVIAGYIGHSAALAAGLAFVVGFPLGLGIAQLFKPKQRSIPLVGRVFSFPQAPVFLEVAAKRAKTLIPARITSEE